MADEIKKECETCKQLRVALKIEQAARCELMDNLLNPPQENGFIDGEIKLAEYRNENNPSFVGIAILRGETMVGWIAEHLPGVYALYPYPEGAARAWRAETLAVAARIANDFQTALAEIKRREK